jgi:hypothetical protein
VAGRSVRSAAAFFLAPWHELALRVRQRETPAGVGRRT